MGSTCTAPHLERQEVGEVLAAHLDLVVDLEDDADARAERAGEGEEEPGRVEVCFEPW